VHAQASEMISGVLARYCTIIVPERSDPLHQESWAGTEPKGLERLGMGFEAMEKPE